MLRVNEERYSRLFLFKQFLKVQGENSNNQSQGDTIF